MSELDSVLQLEQKVSFSSFSHEDAKAISLAILTKVKEENLRRIGVRVVLHDTIVFQYLMDGKEEDIWLQRKQKTVEASKHSSYYVFLKNQQDGSYQELQTEDYAICGGGFPIIVGHQYIGVVCVSGLAHEMDHQLIVDVLVSYQEKGETNERS